MIRTVTPRWTWGVWAACAIGVVTGCSEQGQPADPAADAGAPALSADDIALNNRGVALMGYFDYPGAHDTFAEAVERHPTWSDAQLNLAIATLNRQTEGDEERALALASDVLSREPDHPRAHYISGLLKLYRGAMDEAAGHFETVRRADPDDAYAAYYLGQTVAHQDAERALELYQTAQALDPYLRSAYYGAAQLQRRRGDRDAAKASLDEYARLADNPRARLAEFKYTRMGTRGNAFAVDLPGALPPISAEGALFASPETLARLSGLYSQASLTVADVQGDGQLDLYVASGSAEVPAAVFFKDGDELIAMPEHPLAQVSAVRAAAWGDLDNNGRTDVYLCRDGPNELWLQSETGEWAVAPNAGVADGQHRCADAALLDADHDGDLDILIGNEDGPTQLYSNNLDGTFRPLGNERGLNFGDAPARQVLATDLDNDRDVDLIVIHQAPPHQVFWNDRLWAYRLDEGNARFAQADLTAAVAVDADSDGYTDLITHNNDGVVQLWQRDDNGALAPRDLTSLSADSGATLAAVELDGDAFSELLVHDVTGLSVANLSQDGATRFDVRGDIGAALAVTESISGGPSLWVSERGADGVALKRFAPGPGRGRFAAFTFSGKEEEADSMRSNRSGIGTRVAVRTGSHWALTDTFDHHSGAGQSLQPLAIGLGDAPRADYIAMTWSDGVYQTELDLVAGMVHPLTETQRQLSSCPVIFAYDGERYRFVSDVLGVGGIGFLIEPGRYATPRPWEYFLMPEGAIAPNADGELSVKITEPMEEIAYLDQARLHVFDLAPGWSMVMDERMATGGPSATGAPLFYQRSARAAHATDGSGRDVSAALARTDGKAVSPGLLDPRFIGRTREAHALTLHFDAPLDELAQGARPVLVADGWVEYPYSQTVFSAWQAGAGYDSPTLEAQTADGVWHIVHKNVGYPAGMPRRMALPLDAVPSGTVALRLTSTLQLYWDNAFVAFSEAPGDAVIAREAPLASATLAATGFPRRLEHAQRRPDYNYDERRDLWDSRHLTGNYTRFGDASALVGRNDEAFAIFGPGEEVQVDFVAPATSEERQRHYVLEVRGFAKDMDLYTDTGGTVAPMPQAADGGTAERDALHAKYNTRFEAGG
ncbi:MAG: FG-GAP-like repeat-containing protein [Pseudomonadota bacterium]